MLQWPSGSNQRIGDSVVRDFLMAKMTGVFAIWAKYGAFHPEAQYQQLVRISHWTAEDVENEQVLKVRAKRFQADYVLENNFSEILHPLGSTAQSSISSL